jgi:FAD synthase
MLDFADGPHRVSSTLVRNLIAQGRVAEAARCLGREFPSGAVWFPATARAG